VIKRGRRIGKDKTGNNADFTWALETIAPIMVVALTNPKLLKINTEKKNKKFCISRPKSKMKRGMIISSKKKKNKRLKKNFPKKTVDGFATSFKRSEVFFSSSFINTFAKPDIEEKNRTTQNKDAKILELRAYCPTLMPITVRVTIANIKTAFKA